MAIQNTSSRPLKEESEDEKRKRAAAQDYLEKRDRYSASLKPGYSVDMTDVDVSGMSDEQIKAEGNRRLGAIKSDFESSFRAANKEGISNMQAAQDYLNKGQARIVGDTLVGSAAGISASEWDKRDKSVTSGNNPLMPEKNMVEVAPGVKMGEDTARRYAANRRYQDASDRGLVPTTNPTGPDYAKANAAIQRMVDTKRDRENRGGVAFDAGRTKWNEALKAREDEKNLNDMAKQDMALAAREAGQARKNSQALERAQRRGDTVDPRLMTLAEQRLREAELGLGPTNNVDDQRKRFRSMLQPNFGGQSRRGMGLQGVPIDSSSLQSRRRVNPHSGLSVGSSYFGSLA